MERRKVMMHSDKVGRHFVGRRGDGGPAVVTVDDRPLRPRNDLRNHSPDGFQWGYGGSGPAQLALAILAEATGDDEAALMFYQDFKWQYVATLTGDTFILSQADVIGWFESDPERAAFLARN
jgi:hypothetical protein